MSRGLCFGAILAAVALALTARPIVRAETESPSDMSAMNADDPQAELPESLRGRWKMVRSDGRDLPSPYPDYDLQLDRRPEKCILYKNKGISRLEMARGRLDVGQKLVFRSKGSLELRLALNPSAKRTTPRSLVISQEGRVVLEADVLLVERKPPAKP